MPKTLPIPPPGFDALSVEERLDYVQSLWERITAHPEQVPVPDWHREVVRERLASYRAKPGATEPWGEARRTLLKKVRRRSPRR